MNKSWQYLVLILSCMMCREGIADITVTSPNGNAIVFSQAIAGKNIDRNAWRKVFFVDKNKKQQDLSREYRYYTGDYAQEFLSPSGRYFQLMSVEGGYVNDDEDGVYTDRQYCSVIDMQDGCIISDWTGAICGYHWAEDSDLLIEDSIGYEDTADFLSERPKMLTNYLFSYDIYYVKNLLRCDPPNDNNLNLYQIFITKNTKSKDIIEARINDYLDSLSTTLVIKNKTYLYSSPTGSADINGYLFAGDKVKLIEKKDEYDGVWLKVVYINAKGTALISWIEESELSMPPK